MTDPRAAEDVLKELCRAAVKIINGPGDLSGSSVADLLTDVLSHVNVGRCYLPSVPGELAEARDAALHGRIPPWGWGVSFGEIRRQLAKGADGATHVLVGGHPFGDAILTGLGQTLHDTLPDAKMVPSYIPDREYTPFWETAEYRVSDGFPTSAEDLRAAAAVLEQDPGVPDWVSKVLLEEIHRRLASTPPVPNSAEPQSF